MIRKLFVSMLVGFLLVSSSIAQDVLSNNFNDVTPISVHKNLLYSEFILENTVDQDYELPNCSRMYPGISSYFGFVIPESGKITISANIHDTGLFGLAIYLKEDGELTEITCNVFRDGAGHLTIRENFELYSNKTAIGRIWLIDKNHEGVIELAVTERPSNIQTAQSKNHVVSDPRFDSYLHSDNLNQMTTDEKYELLEMHHKQFADLPYEKEVIFSEIFPKLQSERTYVAPNFPVRASTSQETNENVRYWIENHPDEFEHYLHFVNQIYEQYKK